MSEIIIPWQRANFYGSLTQASTTCLGTGPDGRDIYIPFKDILPMVDPVDIAVDGNVLLSLSHLLFKYTCFDEQSSLVQIVEINEHCRTAFYSWNRPEDCRRAFNVYEYILPVEFFGLPHSRYILTCCRHVQDFTVVPEISFVSMPLIHRQLSWDFNWH